MQALAAEFPATPENSTAFRSTPVEFLPAKL